MQSILKRAKQQAFLKNKFIISGTVGIGFSLLTTGLIVVEASSEDKVDPAKYPWSHSGYTDSYDHAR